MAVISDTAIAEAAASAGFSGENLKTAVAVALAESGGNATAVNDKEPNGSTSYGLWQINSVHSSLLSAGNWRDPKSNAHMAFVIWERAGRKWSPWGAFNNQSYRLYLTRASAVANVGGNASGTGVGVGLPNPFDVPDAIASIADALKQIGRVGDFVSDRHNWLRIATIGAGLVMAWIIAQQLIWGSDVGKAAIGAAKLYLTKGKGKTAKAAAVAETVSEGSVNTGDGGNGAVKVEGNGNGS